MYKIWMYRNLSCFENKVNNKTMGPRIMDKIKAKKIDRDFVKGVSYPTLYRVEKHLMENSKRLSGFGDASSDALLS